MLAGAFGFVVISDFTVWLISRKECTVLSSNEDNNMSWNKLEKWNSVAMLLFVGILEPLHIVITCMRKAQAPFKDGI